MTKKLIGRIPDEVHQELIKLNIQDIYVLSNFLGQCDDESLGFTRTIENLNYSEQALHTLFPSHFNGDEQRYARNPQKIANRIYANRMKNGDESSGDGWKFRGRGYIQLTGKENQQSFFESINLDANSNPELISDVYPLQSAWWFWNENKLSSKSVDVSEKTITEITKIINGGVIGLEKRIEKTNFYYQILNT